MLNLKWSEIDIEDELRTMETLLSASLYMDGDNEAERDIAVGLVDKVLIRIRELKAASEVHHA